MQGDCLVKVETLHGEQQDVHVGPGATMLDLKNAIAEKMSVPVVCQTLVGATEEMQDDSSNIKEQRYQLIIGLAKVQKELEVGSPNRFEVLNDLRRLGQLRGHGCKNGAATLVIRCLADADMTIRQAAVETLGQIAEKGDQDILHIVSFRLKDVSRQVRTSALTVLAQVAEKGDSQVIAAVSGCLQDDSLWIRHVAIMSLIKLAGEERQHAIAALLDSVEDAENSPNGWKYDQICEDLLNWLL